MSTTSTVLPMMTPATDDPARLSRLVCAGLMMGEAGAGTGTFTAWHAETMREYRRVKAQHGRIVAREMARDGWRMAGAYGVAA